MWAWLDNALDYGITEADFWSMTIAELQRIFDSKARVEQQRARERAAFDYTLADLIGYSVGRVYSSRVKVPEICTAYPTLFTAEELAQTRAELSIERFKKFANFHNSKYEKEVADNLNE